MDAASLAREAVVMSKLEDLDAARPAAKAAFDEASSTMATLDQELADYSFVAFQLLLQRLVTQLPAHILVLVLSWLPGVELARLSCVHKAFWVAWRSLRDRHPGLQISQRFPLDRRLVRAAFLGDVAVIKEMVNAGVDERGVPLLLHERPTGGTVLDRALLSAAWRGHLHAVELLLDAGADIKTHREQCWSYPHHHDGQHALDMASSFGHADVAALLIQRGADVHAGHNQALRSASEFGYADLVALLLQHGADVHACNQSLQLASKRGHPAVVELLIQHGADVHACNDLALREACKTGHAAVVELLIQLGANIHADNDAALREACESKRIPTDVVSTLLQHGSDVHADNDAALRLASERGHTAVVTLLIQHGADVHADNDAALRLACIDAAWSHAHADVAQVLMKHGARLPAP
jgi:ankyrin repeat protein